MKLTINVDRSTFHDRPQCFQPHISTRRLLTWQCAEGLHVARARASGCSARRSCALRRQVAVRAPRLRPSNSSVRALGHDGGAFGTAAVQAEHRVSQGAVPAAAAPVQIAARRTQGTLSAFRQTGSFSISLCLLRSASEARAA